MSFLVLVWPEALAAKGVLLWSWGGVMLSTWSGGVGEEPRGEEPVLRAGKNRAESFIAGKNPFLPSGSFEKLGGFFAGKNPSSRSTRSAVFVA